jgi:hypothetical protein
MSCRQCGSNPGLPRGPETGLEEIDGDVLEADFRVVIRRAYKGGSSRFSANFGPLPKTQFHDFRSTALQLK